MAQLRPLIGMAMALTLGCTNTQVSRIYDTCFDLDDCIMTADICEDVSNDIQGEIFTNGICTVQCATVQDDAPDCPAPLASGLGRGSCYRGVDVGGVSTANLCFEPCGVDGDCLFGFVCRSDLDLCGNDPACPIAQGDRICVPGPPL